MSLKSILTYSVIALVSIGVGAFATYTIFQHDSKPAASHADQEDHTGHAHAAAGATDWCAEHSVPESQCTACHPELIQQFKDQNDWCAGHGLPESHCRLCNPDIHFAQEPQELEMPRLDVAVKPNVFYPANATECATDKAIIQFTSAETIQRSGISVEPVIQASSHSRTIEAPAEIVFDETAVQVLTVSVPASVVRWRMEPGVEVGTNTEICELESPEMAELQSEYLESAAELEVERQNLVRAESLNVASLISRAEYQQIASAAAVKEAHLRGLVGRLQAAGLSKGQIDRIGTDGISARWKLLAGRQGTLLDRRATLGVLVEPGTAIALVGEPGALWIEGKIREKDASVVKAGTLVEFADENGDLDRLSGRVFWVAQFIAPESRTVTVRARVTSGEIADLRANRFGTILITPHSEGTSILVPKDAVQWEGCCNVVFVAESDGKFRPRKVSIDRGDRTHYIVNEGLDGTERVVVKGSYLLKTELMRSSMGSGCCGIEAES